MISGKTRKNLAYIAIAIAFILILSYLMLHYSSQPSNLPSDHLLQLSTTPLKAVIIDQLGVHSPNQTFTDTVTGILTEKGYTVDYYDWEKVTVSFFRNLGTHNYTLIILRTHSAVVKAKPNYVCIFSSEVFSEAKYPKEWTDGRLGKAYFLYDQTYYFAITPTFVEYSMKGTFESATIIMMGCDGLTNSNMAKAFNRKGAESYISWNGPVSTSHTDMATSNLLKHLVTEDQTVSNAVAATMEEIGSDPTYLASLSYHQHEPD